MGVGEQRRGGWRGALQDQGRCRGRLPCPLGPREPAGVLDLVLHPPRPEALLGLPCTLRLSPTPPRAPRAFSGPVGPKHRPRPLPKPRPCLSPAPHSQGLIQLFFFPLFSYCDSVLPSGSCLIYIFIFSNISVSFLILFFSLCYCFVF